MDYELRPYQVQARSRIIDALLKHFNPRIVLSLPTGAGKTVTFADLVQWYDGPVLIGVHRRELVPQTVEKLIGAGISREDIAIFGSGTNPETLGRCRVVVAMIQSMSARLRRCGDSESLAEILCRVPGRPLLLLDEIHHGAAATWTELIEHFTETYPQVALLGVTATPVRTDGKGLERAGFTTIIEGPSVGDLVRQGFLRSLDVFSTPVQDLGSEHMEEYRYKGVGDPLVEYRKHAMGRQGILFSRSVGASLMTAQRFCDDGIPAAHVDGRMKLVDRAGVIQQFKDGHLNVLCNHSLVSEGFDVPNVACVMLDRPVGSEVVFRQAVGRAMRLGDNDNTPGVLIDCWGNYGRFNPESKCRATLQDTREQLPEEEQDDDAPEENIVAGRLKTDAVGTDGVDFDPAAAIQLELKPRQAQLLTAEVEMQLARAASTGRKPFSVIHELIKTGGITTVRELIHAVKQVAAKKHASMFVAAEYRLCETAGDLAVLAKFLRLDPEEAQRRYSEHQATLKRPRKVIRQVAHQPAFA